jgi:hypothetical protein
MEVVGRFAVLRLTPRIALNPVGGVHDGDTIHLTSDITLSFAVN